MSQQVYNEWREADGETYLITYLSQPAGESMKVTVRAGVAQIEGYEGLSEIQVQAFNDTTFLSASTTAFLEDLTLGTLPAPETNQIVTLAIQGLTSVPEEEATVEVRLIWVNFYYGSELPPPAPEPTPSVTTIAPPVRRQAFLDQEGRNTYYVTPGEYAPMGYDWSDWLAGETIDSSQWEINGPGIFSQGVQGNVAECIISGAAGYATNQVTTNTGRVSPKVKLIFRLDPRL